MPARGPEQPLRVSLQPDVHYGPSRPARGGRQRPVQPRQTDAVDQYVDPRPARRPPRTGFFGVPGRGKSFRRSLDTVASAEG